MMGTHFACQMKRCLYHVYIFYPLGAGANKFGLVLNITQNKHSAVTLLRSTIRQTFCIARVVYCDMSILVPKSQNR